MGALLSKYVHYRQVAVPDQAFHRPNYMQQQKYGNKNRCNTERSGLQALHYSHEKLPASAQLTARAILPVLHALHQRQTNVQLHSKIVSVPVACHRRCLPHGQPYQQHTAQQAALAAA
jgi:hypothetical protein